MINLKFFTPYNLQIFSLTYVNAGYAITPGYLRKSNMAVMPLDVTYLNKKNIFFVFNLNGGIGCAVEQHSVFDIYAD